MAKQVVESLIAGGKATAAPPLGPALGPLGVNIGLVVADINKKTAAFNGMQVPVKVEVDTETKQYTITVGTPPAASLVLKEAGVQKGSGHPIRDKVADVKIEQIIKIAKMKEDALSGKTLKEKIKEIVGTCQSMGVLVEGVPAQDAIKLINQGQFDEKIRLEKTELSVEELKQLEVEKKHLTAELEKRRAEFERLAKDILKEMEGKEAKQIRQRLHQAGIPETIIKELAPAEEKAPAAGGKK